MRVQAIKNVLDFSDKLYVAVYVMFVTEALPFRGIGDKLKEVSCDDRNVFLIQDIFRDPHGKNDSCQSALYQVHQAKQ